MAQDQQLSQLGRVLPSLSHQFAPLFAADHAVAMCVASSSHIATDMQRLVLLYICFRTCVRTSREDSSAVYTRMLACGHPTGSVEKVVAILRGVLLLLN